MAGKYGYLKEFLLDEDSIEPIWNVRLLNALLQARTKWSWSTKCKKAFQVARKQIASAKV